MDKFEEFLTKAKFPDGHIVVAACKDDCTRELKESGKAWFTNMGSKCILELKYRQAFTFIGILGKQTVLEKKGMNLREEVSVTQVFKSNGQISTNKSDHPHNYILDFKKELGYHKPSEIKTRNIEPKPEDIAFNENAGPKELKMHKKLLDHFQSLAGGGIIHLKFDNESYKHAGHAAMQ